MPRVTDTRGTPGELVMLRGASEVHIWATPESRVQDAVRDHVAVAQPGSIGMIVSVNEPGWTYVLWSRPNVIGWINDGALRRVNQRG